MGDEAHIIFAERETKTPTIPTSTCSNRTAADLDLRPALREQWLLAAPAFALCREDCKGLCPRCGADLNAGPHDCATQTADPRWDALKKLNVSSR